MATELQADENRYHRLFKQFSSESKAVTIASVALIAALLCLLMAWSALNSATHAKAMVEYELQATRNELTALKNEVRLSELYVEELVAEIKNSNGGKNVSQERKGDH